MMGLFLGMSGVLGVSGPRATELFAQYAGQRGWTFEPTGAAQESGQSVAIADGPGGATILYGQDFMEWTETSQHLSRLTGGAVLSLHVHDGDFWMYMLFDKGELIDQFNPVPDYWGEASEAELASWRGDAAKLSGAISSASAERVAPYLVRWTDELLEEGGKAFPDDEFEFGQDWQVVDFMAKLGLTYPDPSLPNLAGYKLVLPAES
jgi:hypothetical protein